MTQEDGIWLDLPRTRAEAKRLGGSRYFTGKPCKSGHIDLRATKTGTCMECARQRANAFREKYPEKKKEWDRRYSASNKEKIAENMRRWLEKNPDGRKRWRDANPDYDKTWKRANPEKVREYSRTSYQRLMSKPSGRLSAAIRAGVRKGIKKGSKSARKTFDILGYTVEELMAHLERHFLPGMSWENYGDWHIDHIIPIAVHNYETPDDPDFKKAWALSNLQPLWAFENISKHAKIDRPFQPSLLLAANDNRPPQKEEVS